MVKTLDEIIEGLSPEDAGRGRMLSEPVKVMVSLRIPLEYRILLDVIAKKANKSRSAFASDLLLAALVEIRESDSFGAESEDEFKKGCLNAGVFLDEFLSHEEQLSLLEHAQESYAEQQIAEQQEGDDVQA